jgi:hypothetical protein
VKILFAGNWIFFAVFLDELRQLVFGDGFFVFNRASINFRKALSM